MVVAKNAITTPHGAIIGNTCRRVSYLMAIRKGGKEAAELAKGWRRDFPRRFAMLDELKKVKL